MKRMLSLLVVLAMVLSMVPTAFAANTDVDFDELIGVSTSIDDISEIAVSLEAESNGHNYLWTPEEDGTLVLTVGELAEGAELEVIVTQGEASAKYSESTDNTVSLDVVAGTRVVIRVYEVNKAAIETVLTGAIKVVGASADDPIMLLETSAELTVPAGQTIYYAGRFSGMIMSFEGENVSVENNGSTYTPVDGAVSFVVAGGDFFNPPVIAITNSGEEAATYSVSFEYPIGSQMNPEAILNPSSIAVSIEEGNSQGYYYKWVSQGKGTLTLTCPAIEGVEYDVVLTNNSTYVQKTLSESEDGTVAIEVVSGDEVIIQVAAVPDENWNYAAVETTLTGAFEFAVGTLENPELVWDPTEIVVTLEEGNAQGYYYTVYNRAAEGDLSFSVSEITEGVQCDVILINGDNIAMLSESEDGTVKIAIKPGDSVTVQVVAVPAEGSFEYPAAEVKLAGEIIYPVGSQMNPEVIWDLSEINVAIAEGNNQGYYYTFYNRAAEGELSFSVVSATEGVEYDVILTNMSDYSMAYLSDSEDGTVKMAIKPGDQINIQVAVSPDAQWNYPAADIKLAGEIIYPIGSQMNPEAILNPSSIAVSVEEGNTQGYYYKWVSQGKGTLTLTCPAIEGVEYDVILTNMSSYAMAWLQDSEDGTVAIDVKSGDEVVIQVVALPDDAWNYAAVETTLTGAFEFAVGTLENPELVWDPTEIVVTLEEGNAQGYYYTVYNRAAEGDLSFSVSEITEGVQCDVILINGDAMAMLSESEDGTVKIAIKPGDSVTVQVVAVPAEGTFEYPAAEVKLAGEIIYPVGSQMNPEVIWDLSEINVAIAEGNSQGYYYTFYNRAAEGELSFSVVSATEGVEYDVILTNMTDYSMAWLSDSEDGTVKMAIKPGDQIVIQVAVSPDAEYNYPAADIKLAGEIIYPIGSQMNPEAVFNPESIVVDIAEGNSQGYYYSWYSRAEGTLVLTCPAVEGVEYDVALTNMNGYAMAWLSDSEDGTVAIDVLAGDQVIIQVVAVPDAEWNYPALQTTLTGEFVYPVGSQMNPEAVFNPESIVVDIAEGNSQGYYYSWYSRAEGTLVLTCPAVEGVEYDVVLTNMNGYAMAWLSDSTDGTVAIDVLAGDQVIIQVVVAADANWNYAALQTTLTGEFVYPIGSQMNPEVITDLESIAVEVEEGNNQGYYYKWISEGKGTLTLTCPAIEGVEYDVVLTNNATSTQKTLAESTDGTVAIEVASGDEVIIQVVAVPGEDWTYAAIETTLTGAVAYDAPADGWLDVDGVWYYYKDGAMVTNDWVLSGNLWYYMKADGTMATGWLQVGTTWYYFKSSGAMVVGWLQVGGAWYYFNASGAMATGWAKIDGTYYYFKTSGAMQTGWLQQGGVWYYLKSSGAMATGWCKVGSVYYYFASSGAMKTGWVKDGGVWYYLKSSGAMATGWLKLGSTWYYFNASGAMQTGPAAIGNNVYLFDENGAMYTGWYQEEGVWYYFNASGAMHFGWLQLNGKWYAFNQFGQMIVGWGSDGTYDYYFDANGVMVTGWRTIDGVRYHFDSNGHCTNK